MSWDAWGVDKEANRIDLPMILYNAIYFVRQCIWIETLETCTIQATRYWTTNSTEIFYVSCQGLAHRFAESGVRGRARLAVPTITTTQLIAPFIRHANRPHDYCYSFLFFHSVSPHDFLSFSCAIYNHMLALLYRSRKQLGLSLDQWNCTSMAKNKNCTNQQQIIEMNLIRHKFDNLKRMTRLWWLTWYIAYGRF